MTDNPQAAFAEALVAFQDSLPHVGKGSKAKVSTKDGGSYSYDYAALPDILDATLPSLTKNGLAFTAAPAMTEQGFVLRFALLHVGGHREEGAYPLPDPNRSTPQQIGSAITYGRRYSFCAVTGIAPDEDDDGQHAADTRARTAPRAVEPVIVTDLEWLEDARHRLVLCMHAAEVEALVVEARRVLSQGRLASEDAAAFKAETDERLKELTGVKA